MTGPLADESQAAIERAEAKHRELIDARPAECETARVLAMLPRAAEFYRDQIDHGLGGDLVAAAKARAILSEMLGEIMLSSGEDGSLWAEYEMGPGLYHRGHDKGDVPLPLYFSGRAFPLIHPFHSLYQLTPIGTA